MLRMGFGRATGVLAAGAVLALSLAAAPVMQASPARAEDATTSSVSPSASPAASPATSPAATPADSPAATAAPVDPASSASPSASPSPSPSAAPTPPPLVMPTELGSWCTSVFPAGSASAEKRKAKSIYAGIVDMGNGGTYRLSEHPTWQPQSGTDTSGDRHVHSLYWALPLLYYGVHANKPAMVERFRQLLYYWIDDHKGARGSWVDWSIYGGLRTQTLVCAAQTLNDPYIADAALRDARTMIGGFRSGQEVSLGTNNTDLIRQTGALAAFCFTGDTAQRDRAWANLVSIARGVVFDDGSDVEGSPGYAMYIESLLSDVEAAAATCGIPSDPIPTLRGALYQFIAQSVRPDFTISSIGDSVNEPLRKTFGTGDWRADWIRSHGAAGAPPTPVYTAFEGGYVFGRAGWNPQPGGADTYYSMRFTSARPNTAHSHDDGGAMTMWSRGVQWIGDPGPYRYENGSSLRWYMKSRPAHSSITVSNSARTMSGGVRKAVSHSDWTIGGNDTTCLVDRTYSRVTVTRCAQYVRSVDTMIVTDYIDAAAVPGSAKQRRGAPTRVVTERWQLPPGVSTEGTVDALALASGDKRLDVARSGAGVWKVTPAKSGSSVGWFTGGWGEKLPGAVLSREIRLPAKASSQAVVTVFTPRTAAESVPVTIDAAGVTVTRNGLTITTPLVAKP